jgi:hypothetical protein
LWALQLFEEASNRVMNLADARGALLNRYDGAGRWWADCAKCTSLDTASVMYT